MDVSFLKLFSAPTDDAIDLRAEDKYSLRRESLTLVGVVTQVFKHYRITEKGILMLQCMKDRKLSCIHLIKVWS